PVTEIMLNYQLKQLNGTVIMLGNFWEHTTKVFVPNTSSPSVMMGQTVVGEIDTQVNDKVNWKSKAAEQNIMHHLNLTVYNLESGVDYIGSAKVKNHYGWSADSAFFSFSTKK
ncbi:unnamed protein product, partial [Meganyctiphanes norvegica]